MPASVAKVFSDEPEAAMVVIGDFAPGVTETTLEPETGFNVFTFPSIEDSEPAVVGGGDIFVAVQGQPGRGRVPRVPHDPGGRRDLGVARRVLVAEQEPRHDVYPDEITRTTAGALGEAEIFRFDMSDLQPSAFGGTPGQGLFKAFTDFVANPDDIDGITQQMEAAAAKAFGENP